jgi:hypothetical protein
MSSTARSFDKVFGIGANKTGTTTLEAILRRLGFRMPNQQAQETMLTAAALKGQYAPLRDFVTLFDAFQDAPFSFGSTYVACDALFPNSRFILTVRDPEVWFDSTCRFHRKVFGVDDLENLTEQDVRTRFHYLYDGYIHLCFADFLTTRSGGVPVVNWDKLYDRDFYIDRYISRNNEIRAYFAARRGDFLEIDLTAEADTGALCAFLDIPQTASFAVPHANRT